MEPKLVSAAFSAIFAFIAKPQSHHSRKEESARLAVADAAKFGAIVIIEGAVAKEELGVVDVSNEAVELKVELKAAPEEAAVAIAIIISTVFTQGVDALYVNRSQSLAHLLRKVHHRVLNRILPHTQRHTLRHRSRLHRRSNRLFYDGDVALGHVEGLPLVRVVQEFHEQELDEVCVAWLEQLAVFFEQVQVVSIEKVQVVFIEKVLAGVEPQRVLLEFGMQANLPLVQVP